MVTADAFLLAVNVNDKRGGVRVCVNDHEGSDGFALQLVSENLAHAHVPTTIVPKGACFERKSFVSETAVRGRFIQMKQP